MKSVSFGFALLLLLCHVHGFADQRGDTRKNLKQVETRIQATEQQIGRIRQRADELTQGLTNTVRELRRTRSGLSRQRGELKRLKTEVISQQKVSRKAAARNEELQSRLQQRLVSLYKGGEVGLARLLFSASSSMELLQDYEFMQRLVTVDQQLLVDYRSQLAVSRTELVKLKQLTTARQKALEKTQRQELKLKGLRKQQKRLLAELENDRNLLDSVLAELEAKANRLGELLSDLESKTGQTYTGSKGDFALQRGRLPWPVEGPVRIGFGLGRHPELGTRYDSHGIEIEVPGDTPIRAVWPGKVIFAQEFRGYGNLLILDHEDGYYSLYAQAERLSLSAGQRVAGDEVVGYSGYDGNDVVYFEIRRGSSPVDPKQWLIRR